MSVAKQSQLALTDSGLRCFRGLSLPASVASKDGPVSADGLSRHSKYEGARLCLTNSDLSTLHVTIV